MNARLPTVCAFGTAAVDFRIRTPEFGPEYREKLLAREIEPIGGGSAANALVQVARLGGRARFLGKLGDDTVGRMILRDLRIEDVDTTSVIIDQSAVSPFNLAAYAGADRRRIGGFLLPNCLAEITAEETALLADHVNEGDWALVEIGEIPAGTVLEFIDRVRARGGRIAVDVDLDPVRQCEFEPGQIRRAFSGADLLIPNRSAVASIYPGLSARELARTMCNEYGTPVVVTVGDEGAWYATPGEEPVYQPPVATEVVDTVGAGDAFHGGLLFGLAEGWTMEHALGLAATCGAITCRSHGARTAMPKRHETGF